MTDGKAVVAKVTRRLVPFLFLCYIVNYLDRFNISFAALEFKGDLGFSDKVYGLGASVFFFGYVFFEVPSNLIMEKVGARVWMARIMVSWGLVSSSMMFVHSKESFYLLRFLLGVAEAGFFPGMIYYLTRWIPARDRGRVYALFMTSTSLAGVLGAPLSAKLLSLSGAGGLKGWQWLFLVEGIPAVVMGVATFFYLTERPEKAGWLQAREKAWLIKTLAAEKAQREKRQGLSLFQALSHPRVWQLCFLYFSIIISFYGVSFWLPQIVKELSGLDNVRTALVSALPFLCASGAMILVGRHSDKRRERRWHVAGSALLGSAGLLMGGLFQAGHPVLGFLSLCVAASGIWSTLGPFWSLPTSFLSGTAAAGGIALINSMGNVGGFVGPTVIGFVKERTHHFESGLFVLAGTLIMATVLALSLPKKDA